VVDFYRTYRPPGYQFWCIDMVSIVSVVLPLLIVAMFLAAVAIWIAERSRNRNEKGLA
jgi:hypothetical protein